MSYEEVIAAYEKKYAKEGERLVIHGDEVDSPERIWPGSLELAYAMGGDKKTMGFPMGRIGRLWGPRSSGKTKVAYSIGASAQKDHGMTVAYINAEKQFEPEFAKAQGVNLSNLDVVFGNVIEQVGEYVHASLPYIDLFILDSTSTCIAAAAKEEGIHQRPMLAAKAWSDFMNFLMDDFDSTRNTLILIDQARVGSLPTGMVGGEKASGGYALEHDSSLTAKFTASSWLNRKEEFLTDKDTATDTVSGMKEPAGRKMKVRIEKSRVGPPFRTAELWFDFKTGDYESEFEYKKWAEHFGMLEGGPNWYTIEGEKVQGAEKVKAWIKNNPDFQEEVKKKVLEIA
jgi:recombination protein RecA